ncbi:MAG: efflux RND transporter periplasmic adaptor subunit [Gammaproteobacteria bacterium]|nr:efflux RND transporter periplasmic adaptor subunit [Gammaproteobacteria bacterium]
MIRFKKFVGASLALAAVVSLSGCGQADEEMPERLRPVRFITVNDDSVFRDRNFSGTSKSSRESRLSFKVSGTVVNVPVQIGQRLNAGDLIAQIDPASYVLQAQQAQASLVEAEANDRRAAANYQRTKGLYASDNASLNDLESARAQAESSGAVVASASKALEIARLNISYTRLIADTDCSIASIDIEVNENVSSGQQVAAVSCGDSFEVTLDLPESLIGRVNENTPVSVNFGAIPNEEFSGVISEIAVTAATGSAGFPVVVQISATHPLLRSGLAANVTFQFDAVDSNGTAVILPVTAVINDPTGTFVFVAAPTDAEGEALVTRRAVKVGELSQSGIEITEGLALGDRVITAGISVIREGQRVLIKDAT